MTTGLITGSVDLGAGSDILTLANTDNLATVAHVETLIGGTGNDAVQLTAGTAVQRLGGSGVRRPRICWQQGPRRHPRSR